MERGHFPIKFALLWGANMAVLIALYLLCDIQFPFFVNIQTLPAMLSGIALVLALLEAWLISKIKGE